MSKALTPQERGGRARRESLSPKERKEIARNAALARWDSEVPEATHEGSFKIGDAIVSAAVLENGKRLLTQATFLRALGRSRSPKAGTGILSTVDGLPFFLQAEVLKPFISEELAASTTPIFFKTCMGKRAVGYDANLLPMVCEVYLKFRDACMADSGEVPTRYEDIITACDIVVRGLARVGIAALIDEATGYQDERARDALAKILEQFVAEELRKWVKTFPLTYFRELCRLRGVRFADNMQLPQYFGHLTNDIIYARLAPGVLDEIQRKNPRVNGRRKERNHQWLSDNVGHPKLIQHLGSVITLMRLNTTYEKFHEMLDRIHPLYRTYPLFEHMDGEND